jgi:hypothetical protein
MSVVVVITCDGAGGGLMTKKEFTGKLTRAVSAHNA